MIEINNELTITNYNRAAFEIRYEVNAGLVKIFRFNLPLNTDEQVFQYLYNLSDTHATGIVVKVYDQDGVTLKKPILVDGEIYRIEMDLIPNICRVEIKGQFSFTEVS